MGNAVSYALLRQNRFSQIKMSLPGHGRIQCTQTLSGH